MGRGKEVSDPTFKSFHAHRIRASTLICTHRHMHWCTHLHTPARVCKPTHRCTCPHTQAQCTHPQAHTHTQQAGVSVQRSFVTQSEESVHACLCVCVGRWGSASWGFRVAPAGVQA